MKTPYRVIEITFAGRRKGTRCVARCKTILRALSAAGRRYTGNDYERYEIRSDDGLVLDIGSGASYRTRDGKKKFNLCRQRGYPAYSVPGEWRPSLVTR